ncbi:MFS transporter [Kineococcus rhizosphaerae]|uniref:Polyol permease family n=1 Tax=Kineococcus rhizosphaerae TaxID=559628 RepID=A0A2T0QMF8_9ACTN|nr:MFS transporter [Kineococcus rhizosphaerae]PRY05678.1 polyol permease family [Kineococcus rhizosphaerae]
MSTTADLEPPSSARQRLANRLGLPAPLILGYLGLLLFMIGDGVESAFIVPFFSDNGAGSDIRASYIVTIYGVAVMLAAWLSGALSELWGPRRVMIAGLIIWLVFDVLLLAVAVPQENYPLMMLFYGLRGFGYPLFAYSFLVWVTAVAAPARLGSAVGWYYFAFTGGMPTLGALVASGSNPILGHYGTLWLSVAILMTGGLIALLGVRERTGFTRMAPAGVKPVQSLLSSASLAWTNPRIGLGAVARMINTIPMFGLLVFMPRVFSDEIGFGESRWLLLVSVMFGSTIIFNLLSGIISDRVGWRETVFWLGCIWGSISVALLYFVPIHMGVDYYWLALVVAVLYGASLSGWVPISALVPSMAPQYKGGAMALLNLGAGASAFVGPALVSLLLAPLGATGVVLIFSALYLIGGVIVWNLRLPKGREAGQAAEVEGSARVHSVAE